MANRRHNGAIDSSLERATTPSRYKNSKFNETENELQNEYGRDIEEVNLGVFGVQKVPKSAYVTQATEATAAKTQAATKRHG